MTTPPPPPPEVVDYMLKELPPLKEGIFPLWKELLSLKVTWYESLRRKNLGILEREYNDLAIKWVNAVEKVTNLNKLIDSKDPKAKEKLGLLMVVGYLKQMQEHENVLSRLMRDFSQTLREKKAEADYKRALFISEIAVFIALISVIVSVALNLLNLCR